MGKKELAEASITVVIPYFQGEAYIQAAIQSIEQQTRLPDEVIVVIDGGVGVRSEYIDSYVGVLNLKTIWTGSKSGQSHARNLGANESKSALICFLDQDDLFLPGHIKALTRAIKNTDSTARKGFAFGDVWSCDSTGLIFDKAGIGAHAFQPRHNINDFLKSDVHILPSSCIFEKKYLLELGGFDESLSGYEDDDLCIRFFLAGYEAVPVREAVTIYRRHSLNSYKSDAMQNSSLLFYKKYMSLALSNPAVFSGSESILANRFRGLFIRLVVQKGLTLSREELGRVTAIAKETIVKSLGYSKVRRMILLRFVLLLEVSPIQIRRLLIQLFRIARS